MEPAAVGAAVVVGPHTYNFQSIVEAFVKAGAIIQLPPMSDSAVIVELANVILDLLADPGRRRELGSLAQALVNENRGATERTLESISPLLSNPAAVVEDVDSMSATGGPLP